MISATATTPVPESAVARPSPREQLLAIRLKLSELWHLIAIHVSDDRSTAVPESLIREAARYLSAHPPEEWSLTVRRPGPERDAALETVAGNNLSEEDFARRLNDGNREVEYARTLFRAVADLVDPIDPAVLEAEARASRAEPAGKTIAEILAEFEPANGG